MNWCSIGPVGCPFIAGLPWSLLGGEPLLDRLAPSPAYLAARVVPAFTCFTAFSPGRGGTDFRGMLVQNSTVAHPVLPARVYDGLCI